MGNFVVEKVGGKFRSWKYRWEISPFFSNFLKISEYFSKSFASVGNYFKTFVEKFLRRSTQLVESCSKTQLSSKMVQTISRYGHFFEISKNVPKRCHYRTQKVIFRAPSAPHGILGYPVMKPIPRTAGRFENLRNYRLFGNKLRFWTALNAARRSVKEIFELFPNFEKPIGVFKKT